jgi:hypothetical protein
MDGLTANDIMAWARPPHSGSPRPLNQRARSRPPPGIAGRSGLPEVGGLSSGSTGHRAKRSRGVLGVVAGHVDSQDPTRGFARPLGCLASSRSDCPRVCCAPPRLDSDTAHLVPPPARRYAVTMRKPAGWPACLLVILAGCSSLTNPNRQGATTYTTVPCADNCGNDPQCLNHCQPVSRNPNDPPPLGVAPGMRR